MISFIIQYWEIIVWVILLLTIIGVYFYGKRKDKEKEIVSKTPDELEKNYKKALEELNKDFKVATKVVHQRVQSKKVVKKPKDKPVKKEIQYVNENLPVKKKSMFSGTYWKQLYYKKFKPDKCVIINMELLNGNFRTFIAKEKDEAIEYQGKTYIMDNDRRYYNLDLKLWCYNFHENYSMPIEMKFPVQMIKSQLEDDPNVNIEMASSPSTLKRFISSKIAEGVLRGAELDAWMKQIRLLLVIVCITALIHFLLWAQKSGMFAQLKGVI